MMRTSLRYCHNCSITITPKEFEKVSIPTNSNNVPLFSISKIIISCSNGHSNECEVQYI
jgi:hypothetical protein